MNEWSWPDFYANYEIVLYIESWLYFEKLPNGIKQCFNSRVTSSHNGRDNVHSPHGRRISSKASWMSLSFSLFTTSSVRVVRLPTTTNNTFITSRTAEIVVYSENSIMYSVLTFANLSALRTFKLREIQEKGNGIKYHLKSSRSFRSTLVTVHVAFNAITWPWVCIVYWL